MTLLKTSLLSSNKLPICESAASATGPIGDLLSLTWTNCCLVVDCGGSHTFFDLACHCQECLLDIGGVLRRGLEEWNAKRVREFLLEAVSRRCSKPGILYLSYLRHCVFHYLLVGHIALVTHEQLVNTLRRISIDFLEPLLHIVERIHVGHIIDNADSVGASIV